MHLPSIWQTEGRLVYSSLSSTARIRSMIRDAFPRDDDERGKRCSWGGVPSPPRRSIGDARIPTDESRPKAKREDPFAHGSTGNGSRRSE